MKKKLLSILLVLVLAFSVTACGEAKKEDTANTDEKVTLTLGINDWPGSYWWFAVKDLGYFEAENVDVEIQLFSNYSDGLNAINSGKIDLFVGSVADVIPGYLSGADIKIIMLQDYSAGADGVIASKDIAKVEDLKGKTIAFELGGTDHLLLLKTLENAGLDPEKDVNIVNMTTGDAANAFMSGSVDCAAIWEPSLSIAQETTGGNILSTSADPEYEGLIPAILIANGEAIDSHRDEIKAVMRAWYNARDAYENNYDEFAKAVADNTSVTADEFTELMAGCDVRTLEQGVEAFEEGDTYLSLEYEAKVLGKFLLDYGLIEKEPDNYANLFDGSFMDEVKEELK